MSSSPIPKLLFLSRRLCFEDCNGKKWTKEREATWKLQQMSRMTCFDAGALLSSPRIMSHSHPYAGTRNPSVLSLCSSASTFRRIIDDWPIVSTHYVETDDRACHTGFVGADNGKMARTIMDSLRQSRWLAAARLLQEYRDRSLPEMCGSSEFDLLPVHNSVNKSADKFSVEEIHSVGTINNVETSYFTQLKMCYLMTTFRCPSDILITSWLFTARWSTWPGNHLIILWTIN